MTTYHYVQGNDGNDEFEAVSLTKIEAIHTAKLWSDQGIETYIKYGLGYLNPDLSYHTVGEKW